MTVYASPDGQDGYYEGARHQARKLSDILAAVDHNPKEDIIVQLTLTDPGAIASYRWRSETPAQVASASCAYEINRFEGAFWWVRTSALADGFDERLGTALRRWLRDCWPFERVAFPGRDISWDDWRSAS